MPFLFNIDPATDIISYTDASDIMTADGGPGGGVGWWTYGATVGDDMYFAPGGAYSVLKVTPSLLEMTVASTSGGGSLPSSSSVGSYSGGSS